MSQAEQTNNECLTDDNSEYQIGSLVSAQGEDSNINQVNTKPIFKEAPNSYKESLLPKKEFEFQFKKNYVIFLTLNASLTCFFIGWSFGVFDTIQINIKELFLWSHQEEKLYLSFISSSIPIGAAVGCLFSGKIVLGLGRRYSFILFDIIAILSLGMTMILNEYCMIAGRFISGLCAGGFSACTSIYINEYVPYEISGACGAIYEFFFCLGIFSSFLFGLGLPNKQNEENQWWRIMIGFPGCWLVLNIILLLTVFKYDTPKYLYINKKNPQQAKRSLETIYLREEDVQQMLVDYKQQTEVLTEDIGYKELFTKTYAVRLFIAIVIMVAQQTSGIDALLMYADAIFLENTPNRKTATVYTNLVGVAQVVSGFTAIFVIEKLGRKTLLLIGMLLITISLLGVATCYYLDYFPPVIYLFLFFTFWNGVSPSPICFVYAADILPEKGVSFAIMFNYLASFIVSETFLFMKSSFLGLSGTIYTYAVCTLFALVICYIGMKETRGLSTVEIDDLFTKDKPKLYDRFSVKTFTRLTSAPGYF